MSQHPNSGLSGERVSVPQISSNTFEWSLRPWWRVILFLIPIMIVSGGLAWKTIPPARAASLLDSASIPDLQKALRQDPGNADLVHRLGLVYSTFPADMDLSEAVKYLQQAVVLNPRRWDFWSDLGTTCDFVGDTACADKALERAWALNPMTPSLQWTLGNHYLLTNRQEKAFPCFRRLVELAPEYYLVATLRLCLRATHDPQTIYAEVVPHGRDAYPRFAFLMLLTSTADYESAMKIWGQMISGPDHSLDLSMVKPFLDFLIDHNQIQDAGTVWDDLQHAGAIPPASNPQPANLLYDGGFEEKPLNTGFGWRISDTPDLVIDFAEPSACVGTKCLRIDFVVGRDADYDLLEQIVRIKPNQRYQLTARVRSNNLTSVSGPRLRVTEVGCSNCGERTSDPTLGTTPWHPIDVEFMPQPQTQAVRISFWRPLDRRGHRDITGTVWLGDVVLRTLDFPGPHVNQERTR